MENYFYIKLHTSAVIQVWLLSYRYFKVAHKRVFCINPTVMNLCHCKSAKLPKKTIHTDSCSFTNITESDVFAAFRCCLRKHKNYQKYRKCWLLYKKNYIREGLKNSILHYISSQKMVVVLMLLTLVRWR